MAELHHRHPENAAGTYYVDGSCIDCDACRHHAPAFFARNDDGAHSFVQMQPQTDDDTSVCEEALENCPVDAIGRDGAAADKPS